MNPPDRTKDNFVLYVPELRHRRFRVTSSGRVVLEFETHFLKKFMGRLVHREPVSDLELDELSSSAWLGMDGKRSILEIARLQCELSGDDIDLAVARIVKFMHYIAKRGWIRFKAVRTA